MHKRLSRRGIAGHPPAGVNLWGGGGDRQKLHRENPLGGLIFSAAEDTPDLPGELVGDEETPRIGLLVLGDLQALQGVVDPFGEAAVSTCCGPPRRILWWPR